MTKRMNVKYIANVRHRIFKISHSFSIFGEGGTGQDSEQSFNENENSNNEVFIYRYILLFLQNIHRLLHGKKIHLLSHCTNMSLNS